MTTSTATILAALTVANTPADARVAVAAASAEMDRLVAARVAAFHAANPGAHFAATTSLERFARDEVAFWAAVRPAFRAAEAKAVAL